MNLHDPKLGLYKEVKVLGEKLADPKLTLHTCVESHPELTPRRSVTQSMSRKGNCFDNAVIESFFGYFKAEYSHLSKIDNLEEQEEGVRNYIYFYSYEHIKLGLQGLSLMEYRLCNTVCLA